MSGQFDTLLRQWQLLRAIPRAPLRASVPGIRSALEASGFDVSTRSIQRDLQDLSRIFPLECDSRAKPYGWSWQRDAPLLDLPSLGVHEALALSLIEQHVPALLPAPVVAQLRPHFRAARRRLEDAGGTAQVKAWLGKIRIVPPTQPLRAPKIPEAVHAQVSTALFFDKRLRLHYLPRNESRVKEWLARPLALVSRGPVTYLHCRLFDYPDVRMLALHRIIAADIVDEPSATPGNYEVDAFIDAGAWGFGDGTRIELVAVFEDGYGDHLLESPLSDSQVTMALDGARLQVSACLPDTQQLRWWLLGFGDGVTVTAPPALVAFMSDTARAMAARYAKDGMHKQGLGDGATIPTIQPRRKQTP